eukprot:9030219-Pyramimonas_sp.AAC.1
MDAIFTFRKVQGDLSGIREGNALENSKVVVELARYIYIPVGHQVLDRRDQVFETAARAALRLPQFNAVHTMEKARAIHASPYLDFSAFKNYNVLSTLTLKKLVLHSNISNALLLRLLNGSRIDRRVVVVERQSNRRGTN